jgi:hypothetical protein
MRWRWQSCSATIEDRVVACGKSLGAALLSRSGRDAKHGAAVAALAADPYPPEAFHRGEYHRLRVGRTEWFT